MSGKQILTGCLISIGGIFGLFFLIAIVSVFAFSDEAKEKYDTAKTQYHIKNYDKALSLVNEIIEVDSINSNPKYFILRGKIMKSKGDSIQFKDDFHRALTAIKNDTLRYEQIFNLYNWSKASRDTIYAKELLYQGLSIFSATDSINFSNSYITAYNELIKLRDTIASINILKSLTDSLKTPIALNTIGVYHSNKNEARKAIKYYKKAIELDSTNGLYYNNLGVSYEKLKNKRLAIKNYKLGIQFENNDACQNLRNITAVTKYKKISRCWDGSSTLATGKGACSHHGGVKNYEYEPYKEYTMSYNCK